MIVESVLPWFKRVMMPPNRASHNVVQTPSIPISPLRHASFASFPVALLELTVVGFGVRISPDKMSPVGLGISLGVFAVLDDDQVSLTMKPPFAKPGGVEVAFPYSTDSEAH